MTESVTKLNNVEFRVFKTPWDLDTKILIGHVSTDGSFAVVTNMEMQTVEPGELVGADVSATLSLQPQEVQNLFDELYRAGFRPSQPTGDAAGELDATKRHLADMRVLVGSVLEVSL